MFYYFGYGSNVNMISLRAKGVTPDSSVQAILFGWKLTFNIPHFFQNEGGVGNVQPSDDPEARVHVQHTYRADDCLLPDCLKLFCVAARPARWL